VIENKNRGVTQKGKEQCRRTICAGRRGKKKLWSLWMWDLWF